MHMWTQITQILANIGTILQSVAVIVALNIAIEEFLLNDRDQKEQEYEAINDIISKTVHPEFVSHAFNNLYQHRQEIIGKDQAGFEEAIGALHSFFWLADSCIESGICNTREAYKKFCWDFRNYRQAVRDHYEHTPEQIRAKMEELGLARLDARCLPGSGEAQGTAVQQTNSN